MLTMHSVAFPALHLSRIQQFCLPGFRFSATWARQQTIASKCACATRKPNAKLAKYLAFTKEKKSTHFGSWKGSSYLINSILHKVKKRESRVLTSGGIGSMPAQFSLHLSKTRRSFRNSTDSMRRCSWSFPSRSWWVGGWYVTPLGSCGGQNTWRRQFSGLENELACAAVATPLMSVDLCDCVYHYCCRNTFYFQEKL